LPDEMRDSTSASSAILVALLVFVPSVSPSSLRTSRSSQIPKAIAAEPGQESVRFDDSSISLVEVASEKKLKHSYAPDSSFFGYKQSNDHSKADRHEAKHAPAKAMVQAFSAANAPRFARVQTTIGTAASAWPSLPTATTQGQGGPYTFGAQSGRGGADYNTPFYGSFNSHQYGPMGGPRSPMMGMGSFPNTLNPRGFGMVSNMSQPWNNPGSPFSPSFGLGKPMIEGKPFPVKLEGYSMDGSHGGFGGGFGGYYGQAPFTGQQFSSMGPYGPFKLKTDATAPVKGPPQKNTTLMGPFPFGPYGQLPASVSPIGGAPFGGQPGFSPYGGPLAGGMGGVPGYGGWGWGGQTMGGLHTTYNPMIAMHHDAMMGGGTQTFSPPGIMHGSGAGYPEPDFDRYHSVIRSPPIPGGAATAKKF